MRRASFSRDDHSHRTLSAGGQTIISRLTVNQKTTLPPERMIVRSLRAHTREFFIDREKQSDIVYAIRAQVLGCKDLCGDDSFRITRPAPVNEFIVLARLNERRH